MWTDQERHHLLVVNLHFGQAETRPRRCRPTSATSPRCSTCIGSWRSSSATGTTRRTPRRWWRCRSQVCCASMLDEGTGPKNAQGRRRVIDFAAMHGPIDLGSRRVRPGLGDHLAVTYTLPSTVGRRRCCGRSSAASNPATPTRSMRTLSGTSIRRPSATTSTATTPSRYGLVFPTPQNGPGVGC